ncbi:MAG: helix-hairpin-helix domain-containing protein [Pseudomonadota bacterium]
MKKWIISSVLAISSSLMSLPTYALPQGPTKGAGAANVDVRKAQPRVNINTADAKVLADGLVGVGPAKAEAIVAWRKQKGPFKAVSELAAVKGIGPALIERNKERLSLR